MECGARTANARGARMADDRPSRIVVSLRVGLTLALANVACAGIVAWAWLQIGQRDQVVSVTGSATQRIQSDLITWRGTVTVRDADLQAAYRALRDDMSRSQAFFKANGVPEAQITVGSASVNTVYEKDSRGYDTTKITGYALRQDLFIASNDVLKVADLSRRATDLIEQGILFESQSPEFLYTKLADLKIQLLAKATQDATNRATQICTNSGSRLGVLRSARMGVMQINAAYSSDVSDSGINDTSAYEKDARAIVSASFAVER